VAILRGIILALGIFIQVYAQNLFVPGKVFLKIVPEHPHLPATISPANFSNFTVQQINNPFKTEDPRLQAIYLLELTSGQEIAFCESVSRLSWVAYAEQVPLVETHYLPNDFDSTTLSHLPLIRATEAWDLEKGSKDITIAIVDNGVLTTQ